MIESVQKILKRLFEAEGFAVEGHLGGRAGLDSFHADVPSAAILDLHLPELSGQHLQGDEGCGYWTL
jgi:FixJ family two-component response regulator